MTFDPGYWALQTAAMLLTCFLIPRLDIEGPLSALLTVVVLAFINSHLWNAALFFKIPDTFAAQALLLVIANGLLFWLVVKILPGISVQGILPALIAPLVFSVFSLLISRYEKEIDWNEVWNFAAHYVGVIREYFSNSSEAAGSLLSK